MVCSYQNRGHVWVLGIYDITLLPTLGQVDSGEFEFGSARPDWTDGTGRV